MDLTLIIQGFEGGGEIYPSPDLWDIFLDAIASLEVGYESQSVRIISLFTRRLAGNHKTSSTQMTQLASYINNIKFICVHVASFEC